MVFCKMLYKKASEIIDRVQKKHGTVKSLVHSCGCKDIKQLYALVCETLKYSSIIDQLLETTGFLEKEKWLEKPLAQVLVYELLFGKGIQCGGKYRLAMKRHKSALNSALARIKIKMGVTDNRDLLPESVKDQVILPRYVRVNTLKSTVQDIVNQFLAEGYECMLTREQASMKIEAAGSADDVSKMNADLVKNLQPRQFMCDLHLEDLLVFPPATDFHDHQLYKTGTIILQDKASCLPAFVLAPPPGSHVIDACAAPGNKTSQLAAILKNTGKVFAFDVDSNRISTMSKLTELSGATNIEIINQDFLTVNPTDEKFANVRYILVDPSCSGSGMVSRLDHLTNDPQSNSEGRLEALAKVQAKLLSHALSFPGVRQAVYSTCSVHRVENEDVVKEVLSCNPDFHLECTLPTWKNRGIGVTDDTASKKISPESGIFDVSPCLRAVPEEDFTNGFFVALFQRKGISAHQESAESRGLEEVVSSGRKRKRKKRKRKSKSLQGGEIESTDLKTEVCDQKEDQADQTNSQSAVKSRKARKRKRKRKGAKAVEEPETKIPKTEELATEKDTLPVEEKTVIKSQMDEDDIRKKEIPPKKKKRRRQKRKKKAVVTEGTVG